jgi:hypothetical protein
MTADLGERSSIAWSAVQASSAGRWSRVEHRNGSALPFSGMAQVQGVGGRARRCTSMTSRGTMPSPKAGGSCGFFMGAPPVSFDLFH